jgi:hypothetical protein
MENVLTVLAGETPPRDVTALMVLRLVLEQPCDLEISPDRFVARGLRRKPVSYAPRLAPAVLAELRKLAPGLPPLYPGERAQAAAGNRRLFFEVEASRVRVYVRGARDVGPSPLPAWKPDEPVYVALALPCRHCDQPAPRFRRLANGALVCPSCARSFLLS